MATNPEWYYDRMLQEGQAYEAWVKMHLEKQLFIRLDLTPDLETQKSVGETLQGIEIKYDRKYAATGNIYIELSEKCRAWKQEWTRSGVYRDDNTWLIAIGNYETIYLFAKRQLQRYVQAHWSDIIKTETSIGILLDADAIDDLAVHIIKCEEVE